MDAEMANDRPKRTLVVSNIHGAYRALQECLMRSKYNPATDRLIILGDYVGRYPDSPQIVESLLWIQACAKFPPIFIKGDADKWCGSWLKTGKANSFWFQLGGAECALTYMRSKFLGNELHEKFFNNLLPYYVDEENRAYVHAGFTSEDGLHKENNKDTLCFDLSLWGQSIYNDKKYDITKRGCINRFRSYIYREVFIGHQATTRNIYTSGIPETLKHQGVLGRVITQPMQRRNIWNINTGVDEGHKLTIMDVDSKQYWQSTDVDYLYPEKLREVC